MAEPRSDYERMVEHQAVISADRERFMRDVDARQREIEFEAHIRFVAEHRVDGEINWLADDIWDALAGVGIADVRGGTEYERRIAGLRAWLRDEDGQPPETGP